MAMSAGRYTLRDPANGRSDAHIVVKFTYRAVLQVDQAALENPVVLRHKRERRQDTDPGRRFSLRSAGDHQKAAESRNEPLHHFANNRYHAG